MSASKPTAGAVLHLGERTFRLRFDLMAAAIWHDRTNKDLTQLTDPGALKIGDMLELTYAAICAHASAHDQDPPVTIGQLGALIDSGPRMTAAGEALRVAFSEFSTRSDAESNGAGGKGRSASQWTGGGSGASTSSEPSTSDSASESSGDSRSTSSSPEPSASENEGEKTGLSAPAS